MRRIGNMDRRIELIEESMQHAIRHRLRPHQLFCWEHLCNSYALLGRIPEAEEALSYLHAAYADGAPLFVGCYASNKAYLAYLMRDAKSAQALLPVLQQATPLRAPTSVHGWLSSRVAVKIVCAPSTITSSEIEELVSYHRSAAVIAGHEDRLNILVEALVLRGDAETAQTLAGEYAQHTARRLGLRAARSLRQLVRVPPEIANCLE
jgi:hypothetical protein